MTIVLALKLIFSFVSIVFTMLMVCRVAYKQTIEAHIFVINGVSITALLFLFEVIK